ncbi:MULTISPECIES: M14 family metallopeptidase [Actinosynnema]|uniref:Zinc carboxypeptidase n=2 Tax=Actinosynnema TaxID=40566 RepID=C6WCF0_ACTMD|nr:MULTISPECIES: M14 family metallopeptidase [Actinosynnema]ACU39538.1 peptidase M14 carboxypeptidase A [Actinosynnema mirum DSM 43827]MCP2094166.1 Zinc carboxypeptidase [Actinosynnema pretiosum]QUF03100.1 zinc carboxypeptidase [Actinosynnema pretiosum subsp. pretiosum]
MSFKRRGLTAVALGACLVLVPLHTGSAQPSAQKSPQRELVEITAVDAQQRTRVADTGVDVLGVDGDRMTVVAEPNHRSLLTATGLPTRSLGDANAELAALGKVQFADPKPGEVGARDFPSGYTGYHNYAEMVAELRQTVTDHPTLVTLRSIGKSYEGRDQWAIKLSDNPSVDEAEPEVLFTCNQHAREHLTVEMCLHIIKRYTDGYATNPTIKSLVDSREIWIVPSVNPDGAEYDIAAGTLRAWRKNRQPNSTSVGTDPNRNWGYKWGCCGGSSGSGSSETYRGTAAFSAPETRNIRDFVGSRVVGGVQQIKANIDWHTYSELILWPYGYTYSDTDTGLNATQASVFSTLGRRMAALNGYTPQQASDLYITDGAVDDWMWGTHKIWSYTFEMYPSSGGGTSGFYPRDTVIAAQTARNDSAVELFLGYADCPPRIISSTC